jgi:arsenate reductase (thioredoxin)
MSERVVFVCLHGAAKSRIAAAWFNWAAPPGWSALSAGLEPDAVLSPTAGRLLAGTEAEPHLDPAPPRSLAAVDQASRIIGIDCDPGGATDRWVLDHGDFDAAMQDEIHRRVEALVTELSAG